MIATFMPLGKKHFCYSICLCDKFLFDFKNCAHGSSGCYSFFSKIYFAVGGCFAVLVVRSDRKIRSAMVLASPL